MKFIETRTNDTIKPKSVEFSQAILSPSASYGGLYIPESLPQLDEAFFQEAKNWSYKELAKNILLKFKIDIDKGTIDEALSLYDKFDDGKNPAPLTRIGEKLYIEELWHGPTRAFKDMALQRGVFLFIMKRIN